MKFKTDNSEIQDFLNDASNFKGTCEGVYFPQNEADIIEILKDANRKNLQVTVSGNGTGLNGGRVPEGGIVISTNNLNRVIEINEEQKYAVVETGVLLSEFHTMIEQKGLFYPPDPTEQNCFLGATVANNSSGAKSFKYGPTRDYVEELDVILPTGDKFTIKRGEISADGFVLKLTTDSGDDIVIQLPRYRMPDTKNSAGYYCKAGMDAIDLFIGSEGTLGIITRVKLKLIDKPENILSCVVFFSDENDALNFIAGAVDLSVNNDDSPDQINALGLEYFDKYSLRFMKEEYPQIPAHAGAAVWFEQEINDYTEEILLDKWVELLSEHNADIETAWIATNDKDREKFKDFRHAVSSKVTEYITREGIRKIGTDTAVPKDQFPEYYNFITKLVEENNIKYIVYGHAGDSHLHLNMMPVNQNEYDLARNIYHRLCEKAVEMKGTVSAEHGIGKLKRNYLKLMYSDENLKAMAKVKRTLDPNLILNIGNIIDPEILKEV
ncbi:MAG: FAD-binding oxidoreductase [Melioribacteraceae bacterium]|nr:FAD-binding oxidoreductase [Melioribacteraceae bacterium]